MVNNQSQLREKKNYLFAAKMKLSIQKRNEMREDTCQVLFCRNQEMLSLPNMIDFLCGHNKQINRQTN